EDGAEAPAEVDVFDAEGEGFIEAADGGEFVAADEQCGGGELVDLAGGLRVEALAAIAAGGAAKEAGAFQECDGIEQRGEGWELTAGTVTLAVGADGLGADGGGFGVFVHELQKGLKRAGADDGVVV